MKKLVLTGIMLLGFFATMNLSQAKTNEDI